MPRSVFTSWVKRLAGVGARESRPGAQGEAVAYDFLRQRGFQILARNYRRPGIKGEIDLVGWDQGTLVFIEVKTRRSKQMRVAEDAVDAPKRQALIRMARLFRRRARLTDAPYRFDVVSVYQGDAGRPAVEHFPAAFREPRGR